MGSSQSTLHQAYATTKPSQKKTTLSSLSWVQVHHEMQDENEELKEDLDSANLQIKKLETQNCLQL